jgi:hypothetical protein
MMTAKAAVDVNRRFRTASLKQNPQGLLKRSGLREKTGKNTDFYFAK